jgi:hypothetical protein
MKVIVAYFKVISQSRLEEILEKLEIISGESVLAGIRNLPNETKMQSRNRHMKAWLSPSK